MTFVKNLFEMQLTLLFTLILKQHPSEEFSPFWPHSTNDWMHKSKGLDPALCNLKLFINFLSTITIDLLKKDMLQVSLKSLLTLLDMLTLLAYNIKEEMLEKSRNYSKEAPSLLEDGEKNLEEEKTNRNVILVPWIFVVQQLLL